MDQLEVYGFNYGCFGFYKFENKVDLTDFKNEEFVKLKNMRMDSSKEVIGEDEYFKLRGEMIKL